MSKLALINDIHFGVRNDAQFMLEYQERFFTEVFFPKLKEENITTVLVGGDIFDRRKYVNFYTAKKTNEMFFDVMQREGIEAHVIPGNHDVYFKSTNDVSSLDALLTRYRNVIIHNDATTLNFDGVDIDFIPWINNKNYAEMVDYMTKSTSKLCYGHFEIQGCEMYRGVKNDHGMKTNIFKNYDEVWSGHFHCKSQNGNIKYLGAPMEFTFADCDDPRGFHIFDTETKQLTFIQNHITLFEKFYYDDSTNEKQEEYKDFDVDTFKNKIVKIFVVKKTFPGLFETLVDRIVQVEGINVSIQEDFSEFHADNVGDIEKTTTKELMENYVDDVETNMDKTRIKTILNNAYIEALHEELN